mmetsp:Transcript_21362/g.44915  ORF Transcript_21362/g.44915 Transcript_21362/m.44915 type:complete len:294 (-) Transcript_21362:231-1112(-)
MSSCSSDHTSPKKRRGNGDGSSMIPNRRLKIIVLTLHLFLAFLTQLQLLLLAYAQENLDSQACNNEQPSENNGECTNTHPILKSKQTQSMTLRQLQTHYQCQTSNSSVPRPLPTPQHWQTLRTIYRSLGGTTVEHDETNTPEDFIPPTRSGQTTDGKGRGIFAAKDIRKGERTYGGKKNFAFFSTGNEFRNYVDEVANQLSNDAACDIMMWAWVQPLMGDDYETLIVVVLDNNSLMNDGGEELANTGCLEEEMSEYECGMFDEYALRDIREGEEILCDYDRFEHRSLWKEFGL